MRPLTVTWQPYDRLATHDPTLDLGGLGGFFKEGMRWPDYLEAYEPEWHAHLEAIRLSIVANRVWGGGDWHQESAAGAPLLSDGHYLCTTYRDWGDLLAATWSSELNRDFSYMDFYIDVRLPARPFE
ncbi:hypothetical protein JAO73_22640 [Hymenobacter sp. BT523]|uniref:hypothetical protein n=1 Tax=Hymenobacter sp. BT523 TaxID=2795725 RepID=UPI0018ECBFDA|nr:hypothetical protein [Hymenobacter sp. BT523]MBJ6111836.1 hypothetical protein [Hymenobacter sp. BT523]